MPSSSVFKVSTRQLMTNKNREYKYMFNSDTDKEWEKLGRNNPYFGVLTDDKYRTSNLTDENIGDFFESGSEHIKHVLKFIRNHIDPNFTIKKALDFGCGVGRLVVPLADHAQRVTGIDVSASMLTEAKKNCENKSIKNVDFAPSNINLSSFNGTFDFIHSYIVFQHIPVKRGESLFENLITRLASGGVGIIHFTYANDNYIRKIVSWIKSYIPLSKYFFNLIKGRNIFTPEMQMNLYDLNKLFSIMQKFNIFEFHAEYTNHGGYFGIVLYFRKP